MINFLAKFHGISFSYVQKKSKKTVLKFNVMVKL